MWQHRRYGKQGVDGYEVPTGGRRQQLEVAVQATYDHVRIAGVEERYRTRKQVRELVAAVEDRTASDPADIVLESLRIVVSNRQLRDASPSSGTPAAMWRRPVYEIATRMFEMEGGV
ncbi:hypothetical protein [Actinopolymorpha pittospori]|uniref:hypothetical protein n=1 Tax=Actinopolymorpha pittospori TaxID=648752 RepID=UPI0017893949|nr:hypothetical protein [Actinopolymorpha pittospori]